MIKLMEERITIGELRKQLPGWTWKAERTCSIGWEYHGCRGDDAVRIYATAVLSGYSDDEFHTVWMAQDAHGTETLSFWRSRPEHRS